MTTIKFIDSTGTSHLVDTGSAATVMQVAKDHLVPGIFADCGGACACATCHVVVADDWAGRLAPPSDVELQMLEFALHREGNSRLSCQIKVAPTLDGLELRVASSE